MALSDYHASVSDWRAQLRLNEQKTRLVIVLFILIYLAVGIIADLVVGKYLYPHTTTAQYVSQLINFHVVPYATLIMAAIAAVSILIMFSMYDTIMLMGTDYREITAENAQNLAEKQLYHVVEEMKVAAGLHFMPKVFIINADYMNAFASGYSERSAMVAITRGLMAKLNRAELQAVMAHELSHIRHQDIKLTLAVTVLSNILLLVIDALFYSVIFRRNDDKRDSGNNILALVIVVLRYVLPLITVVLTLFLSRTREYMADAGSVELMRDNEPMARALLKISQDHEINAAQYSQDYGQTPHEQMRQSSYLFDPSSFDPVKSLSNLFSTHPATEQRLRAIGFIRKGRGG